MSADLNRAEGATRRAYRFAEEVRRRLGALESGVGQIQE